jgi:hypothetical protein
VMDGGCPRLADKGLKENDPDDPHDHIDGNQSTLLVTPLHGCAAPSTLLAQTRHRLLRKRNLSQGARRE